MSLRSETEADRKVVTTSAPTKAQIRSLLFPARVCWRVKWNSIVVPGRSAGLSVGAGQMNCVDSLHLAIHATRSLARDSMLASNAFFPLPYGVGAAIDRGVRAFQHPGGWVRDEEIIAACDKRHGATVFAGPRRFRHSSGPLRAAGAPCSLAPRLTRRSRSARRSTVRSGAPSGPAGRDTSSARRLRRRR